MEREQIILKIKEFLESYYKDEIARIISEGKRSLVISFEDLQKFDKELAEELLENPEDILEYFKQVLKELIQKYTLEEPKKEYYVRVKDIPREIRIRDIRSEHIGKLIQIEGIIKLASEVRPMVIAVKYKHDLPECQAEFWYPQYGFKIEKPKICPVCKKSSGKFIEIAKKFIDTQRLLIEEPPDVLEGGEQPRRINVFLRDDLCEPKMERRTLPGNRVKIVGIPKEIPLQSKQGTLYDIVIEAIYIETVEKSLEEIEITKEDELKIKEIAASPNFWNIMVRSIAPSIHGYEEIKKAILLQLVGGVKKIRPDGTVVRGNIHILLVGDPGVAKTILLRYASQISPKGKYVSGKSASAVGLTATVVRDEFLKGGWALEAGALVLASGGICAIDEFDKIPKQELAALHEAMESQTITVTKANIHATLKAETSVLAAANPKYGRWDPMKTIAEQIDLPPTILNRFDLIFVIRDIPDEKKDEVIASHILNSLIHPEKIEPILPPEFLKKYIAYARRIIPKWTEEAAQKIKEFYLKLRKAYNVEEGIKAVPISPRQLEALIRLAEASARLRLSKYVTVEDAELAINLLMYSMKQVGIDPETGKLDVDIIAAGVSASQRSKISIILDIIDQLEKTYNGPVPINDILTEAERYKIPKNKAEEIIQKLLKQGELYEPKPGFIQRAR